MFDKYMICEDGFKNIADKGNVTGFQFGARLPYYRGLGLSMVDDISVAVDGVPVPRDHIMLTVSGKTYRLEQLESASEEERWEMGDIATLTVRQSGGLPPGAHKLELVETLRISYLPFPSVTKDTKILQLAAP
jgi:hypothetical protein